MKKSLSILLAVICLLTAISMTVSAAANRSATLRVVTKATDVRLSDDASTFRVAVRLESSAIATYIATVQWDASRLELVGSCRFTDGASDGWDMIPDSGSTVVNTNDVSKGSLTVASTSATNRSRSSGELFILEFKAKKSGAAEIRVTAGSANVSAQNALACAEGKIENVTTQPLTVNVAPAKGYKRGDVNNDGRITARDAFMVKAACWDLLQLTEEQKAAADVDGNGRIQVKDYFMIKSHILGIAELT